MRRLMLVAAVMTAFTQSSSVAFGDSRPSRRPAPIIMPPVPPPQPDNNGLCRRAPALPQLAAEGQGQPPQPVPPRWGSRTDPKPVPMPVPMAVPEPDVMVSPAAPPPPPPPPPPMGSDALTRAPADAVAPTPTAPAMASRALTGRAKVAAGSAVAEIAPAGRGRSGNGQVQSGQLTAGEHDDLLNPALYASYVSKFLGSETLRGIPRVDTGKALYVVVTDASGAPMPFATVTLTCSDNNTLSLTTMADGRVAFFPELDRLGTSVRMVATAPNGGNAPVRTINVTDVRGAQTVRTQISSRAARVTKFDLAVVIDATGSMGDEINYLKAELRDIVGSLSRRHQGLDIRVALVVYRDQGDEFVTRTFEFTSDINAVQRNLDAQSAGGGGDMPEAMEVAMARAVGLNWRNDAIKSMLLVADAPPHGEDVPATWAAAEVARAKRIQIVPVAASGVDDAAQYIMRAMAAATQSRYAFLTDDSGIGNAHAEPSVDCYHVTKLDALVRRILDSQISGRRIEPEAREIVRTVGDYDNGRCRGA